MIDIQSILSDATAKALKELYGLENQGIDFQETRKEFEGDITLVVFPYVKAARKSAEQTAEELGKYIVDKVDEATAFNVVKGFLNISIADAYWLKAFYNAFSQDKFGISPVNENSPQVMVEYSSPNTNKPLHLGHIRNNLLGWSVAQIIEATGKKVQKVQIINDRGIHICKSMLAWQKFGAGETPENTGMKGDALVGKYYVEFDKAYKKEIAQLIEKGKSKEVAEKEAPMIVEAQEMLRLWEAGDNEVVSLWKTMNGWVYDGFNITYKELGVEFDKNYYESNTYLLGKAIVLEGLEKGVFYKKEDGSVWVDLTDDGLDEKILLRSDGTSVYMTQDIGTAIQRFKDFDINSLIYTVGNEQDYHFKVLFLILKKLGYEWADNLYHLSYGMVDLPSGKMKSREGTVVDADDLMQQMTDDAKNITEELGKLEAYSEEEKAELYKTIGLGALKYFILKVDARKRMVFNPADSIDFNGNTGPFIQYTHARIKSLFRKHGELDENFSYNGEMDIKERELIKNIFKFPEVIKDAADNYNPSTIASYTYDLVKGYNTFYQNVPIFNAEDEKQMLFRLQLSKLVAEVISNSMRLLGIGVPERM